jgi:hypothetical protein
MSSEPLDDEKRWSQYVREKAHAAILLDLREFDWSSLSPEIARKIHSMLPPDKT